MIVGRKEIRQHRVVLVGEILNISHLERAVGRFLSDRLSRQTTAEGGRGCHSIIAICKWYDCFEAFFSCYTFENVNQLIPC